MKLNRKKLLIGGGAAVLAAAIGMGALALAGKGGKDPIYVYDFSIVGMTADGNFVAVTAVTVSAAG